EPGRPSTAQPSRRVPGGSADRAGHHRRRREGRLVAGQHLDPQPLDLGAALDPTHRPNQRPSGPRHRQAPPPRTAARRGMTGAPRPLEIVVAVEAVPAGEVIGALRTLAPTWAPYKQLTVPKLVAALAQVGLKVPTTRNKYPIDPVTV